MKKRQKWILFILALGVVVVWLLFGVLVLEVANAAAVCPEGDGWSSHQSPPLTEIAGASKYCVKGGSESSQGCQGYLVQGSYSVVSAAGDAEGACGLSHWSYYIPSATATSTPTVTYTPEEPTPTDTPEEPTPTSTETPEKPTSTPTTTETPEGPTSTPTDTPTATETPEGPTPTPTETHCHTPTPTESERRITPTLPYTGNILYELRNPEAVSSYLNIPEIGVHTSVWLAPYTKWMGWDIGGIGDLPTMLDGTHAIAGHLGGMFYDLYLLEPGDYIFLNGTPYVMREERFVSPFDMDVLAEGDLVLFTCSWWTGSIYRYRRVIIAELVQ